MRDRDGRDVLQPAGQRRRRLPRPLIPIGRLFEGSSKIMATDILMPALSPTMEQGKLAKWLKKEGDKVKPGDILAEIETDKATMEVEAIDEGILAKILVPDDTDNVAVNTPIAILAGEGEDVAAAASKVPAQPAAQGNGAGQPAPTPDMHAEGMADRPDRKSTRLNSSHANIS